LGGLGGSCCAGELGGGGKGEGEGVTVPQGPERHPAPHSEAEVPHHLYAGRQGQAGVSGQTLDNLGKPMSIHMTCRLPAQTCRSS
jgi:hypothetical protein